MNILSIVVLYVYKVCNRRFADTIRYSKYSQIILYLYIMMPVFIQLNGRGKLKSVNKPQLSLKKVTKKTSKKSVKKHTKLKKLIK